jgi:hypothetical protein
MEFIKKEKFSHLFAECITNDFGYTFSDGYFSVLFYII